MLWAGTGGSGTGQSSKSSLMQDDIDMRVMAERNTHLPQWLEVCCALRHKLLVMKFAILFNLLLVNILRKIMISYVECWSRGILWLQHLDFLIPRCACGEVRYDSHLCYIIRYRVLMFLF